MIEPHVRDAFHDLVDGRGAPHEHAAEGGCASCQRAAELHGVFEREFDAALKNLAVQPLPADTLEDAPRRPGWLAMLAPAGALVAVVVLVIAGIALTQGIRLSGVAPSSVPIASGLSPEPTAQPPSALDAWRSTLPKILASTSASQVAILRDGIVTQEEHESAQDAYVSCMRDAGVIVGPRRDALGIINGLTLDSHDPNLDVDEVREACHREWYDDVWPAWQAAALSDAGGGTHAMVEEFLNARLASSFPDDECVSEADARTRIRDRLDALDLADWQIIRSSYGEGAACVTFGSSPDTRAIVIVGALSVAEREGGAVAAALERFADGLLSKCLDREQATEELRRTLAVLGVTGFEIRSDPLANHSVPNDEAEAYQQHVDDGCFVYGGRQVGEGGQVTYHLWGPWP